MDDSKIFMFPDGGTRQTSSDVNNLLPLLMCNGGFNGGGSWVWIIFLFFLYPLYVKDVIDDVDGYDGIAFNRWYADMCRKGIQVDWYNCR